MSEEELNNHEDNEDKNESISKNLLKFDNLTLKNIYFTKDRKSICYKEIETQNTLIEGLSPVILKYPLVESLVMSKNRIKKLDYIDQLKFLESADFSGNSIQNVGCLSENNACPALISLNLGTNIIFSVNAIKCMTLVHLDVSYNNIEKLANSTLPALKTLNASNNQITQLNIADLRELEDLNLASNNLSYLFSQGSIENLPKLQKLNLAGNKISKVEIVEGLETNFKELRTLNLANNLFELVEDVTLFANVEIFEKLVDVNFDENPFMSINKLKTADGGSYNVKVQLIKDFRHLSVLNGKSIKTSDLKKAFEFDKYVFNQKKMAEMQKDEMEAED